jgi:hypothetical protein
MLLPYDIFSNIISFSDMKTIFNLYRTDKKLREICLNDSFGKILIKTSNNKYFNLDAKSELLDKFLNTMIDADIFDRLQLTLSRSLSDKLTIIISNAIGDDVNDIQSNQISTSKILFYGCDAAASPLIGLLRLLNLSIDFYLETIYDDNSLYNIETKDEIYYHHIKESNDPIVKFGLKNNLRALLDIRNSSQQNILPSLLNFLLDGYRKLCIY